MAVTLTSTLVTTGGQTRVNLSVTSTVNPVTITRTQGSVTVPVRGGTGDAPFSVTDWEVPTGSVTYTGSATGTASDSDVVVLPAPTCLWIVPLVDADTDSIRVDLGAHTAFGRGLLTDVLQPIEGGPALIATTGRAAESGRVVFKTDTTAQTAALDELLGKPVWVAHDPAHGFGPFYAVFLPDGQDRLIGISSKQQRLLAATYYVQDRPEATTSGRVTWIDVYARGYTTWQALANAYGTWDGFLADAATWNQ